MCAPEPHLAMLMETNDPSLVTPISPEQRRTDTTNLLEELTQARADILRLRALAYTDSLTSLANHRHLQEALDQQVATAERYHRPFSLISFDLDHFKRINDSYGHPVGDDILQELGKVTSPLLRSADTLGRWGGEEFLLITPETNLDKAQTLAERLRQAIASHAFSQHISITASFGITTHEPGDTADQLLKRVDIQLYCAKQAGRNCIR